MSVLIPNTYAGVRRKDDALVEVDAFGDRVGKPLAAMIGPWPAQASEDADGHWLLSIDPAAWPVRAFDVVVETDAAGAPTGRTWTVTNPSLHTNAIEPDIDHVRCIAQENKGTAADPEPIGREFVGR